MGGPLTFTGGQWIILFLGVLFLGVPFIGLFDLLALWATWLGLRALLQWTRFGTSYLEFESFPASLDSAFRVIWRSDRNQSLTDPTFTLRCVIEEHIVCEPDDGERNLQVAVIWSQRFRLPAPHPAMQADRLPFEIPLPSEPGLGSTFDPNGNVTARYWELLIHAPAWPVAYRATFLLPVYATENSSPPSATPHRV